MERIKASRIVNQQTTFSMLFSLFVFISINLPSIKLLYSSLVFNFVALTGIIFVGGLRCIISNREINFNYKIVRYSLNFIIFWLILLLVTWIMRPSQFTISDLLQYLSVVPFTFGVLFFLKKKDFKYIAIFQVIWGTAIAFAEWTIGIPKNSDLGQNYLTTGVVIAATVMVVIGVLLTKEVSKGLKIGMLIPLVILFLGLSSLSGRAPILLSALIPIVVYLLSVLMENNLKKKLITVILMFFAVVVLFYILKTSLSEYTLNRISRIFTSIQEEPRYEVYRSSIQAIKENSFGLGLTGYRIYNFGYPHNIFLEILMSGGIITIIPFLGIIMDYFVSCLRILQSRSNAIIWMNLSLYYFLTWNISFNLSSSYMVFIAIAVFIKADSYVAEETFAYNNIKFINQEANYLKTKKNFNLLEKNT